MLEIFLLVVIFIFLWRGVDWVCREWENVLDRDLPMISFVKANAKRVSSKTPKTKSGNADVKANSKKSKDPERGGSVGQTAVAQSGEQSSTAANYKQSQDGQPSVSGSQAKQQSHAGSAHRVSRMASRGNAHRGGRAQNTNPNVLYIA